MLREKATYEDDKIQGTVHRYDPEGRLKEKQTYRDGKPLGPPIEYDTKGRPKKQSPPPGAKRKPRRWWKLGRQAT